jgi:fatty acid synthase subunit alpha
MATRPLKAKYETTDNSVSCSRTIFCHAKDVKEVYQYEDELDAPSLEEAASDSSPPVAQAIPVPASGPAVSVEDLPVKAVIFTVSPSLRSSRKRSK